MIADNHVKNGKIFIWKGKFAVLKSKKPFPLAFANIKDKSETTVILDQSKINGCKNIIKMEKGWKLLTFDMVLPFGAVGFLAKISKAMAEENIGIMAISSFSTDHILVKAKDLDKAIKKLGSLGMAIKE